MNDQTVFSHCIRLSLFALLCVGLAGCGTSSGCHASCGSWGSTEEGGIPGIDSGTLIVAKRSVNGNELEFAVWTDLPDSPSGVSAKGHRHWVLEGTIGCRSDQENPFPLKCTVSDDLNATMTIAGVDYPVPDGTLFLVATGSEKPQVKQLKFDLQTPPANEPEFAKSNPQIADFFRTTADSEKLLTRKRPSVEVEAERPGK